MADERATNSLDKRIGGRIRARRLEIGMAQETLAQTLGITFQQVQKYEKGVNRVAASRLHDISVALELPIHCFYDEVRVTGTKKGDAEKLDGALAIPGTVELALLFSRISSGKLRKQVLDLVRTMAGERD